MALTREQVARRIAQELKDGWYVNLGIGLPTLVANYIPPGIDILLHSENGLLGIGPWPLEGEEDPDPSTPRTAFSASAPGRWKGRRTPTSSTRARRPSPPSRGRRSSTPPPRSG